MTRPNNLAPSRWLDYLMLRLFNPCSIAARKLLLLRLLFSRAALWRAILGSLLLAHLKPELAIGGDEAPVFKPFNMFVNLTVNSYSSPELVDIDGDGDLDAFIGEKSGDTLYFANIGSASSPAFAAPQTNPFGLTKVVSHSNPVLVDIDGDSDLDAFIGTNDGNILYFANIGSATKPAFTTPKTNPFGLKKSGIFYVSPALVDIDGDKDLDAFIGGKLEGITYYNNIGSVTKPVFAASQNNPFGLIGVGNDNIPSLVDIDGDNDLDIFIGRQGGDIIYFANTGTATKPIFGQLLANPLGLTEVGGNASPVLVDIDNDGDLDAFVGSGRGDLHYFSNVGTPPKPAFVLLPANPFDLPTGIEDPILVDIDSDGDLDAFGVADAILYFANIGTATKPAFATYQTDPFGLVSVPDMSSLTLADIDGDGDLDIFMGSQYDGIFYFANTGSATKPAFAPPQTNPFNLTDVGDYISPELVDIDGDADLDAFIGTSLVLEAGSGDVFYFANTGNTTKPIFAPPQTNPFGLTDVGTSSTPELVDIDADGDLDAFIGNGFSTYFFRNVSGQLVYFPFVSK